MSENVNKIFHPGIVESLDGDNASIKIQPQSSCGSCHSKSFCNLSDSAGKIIDVKVASNHTLKVGEEVTVTFERSLGYKALLIGYLIPFVLLVSTIFVILHLTQNEGLAALIGVLIMIPYYGVLYRFKDKIKNSFEFKIKQ